MIEHYFLSIRFVPGLLKEVLCIEKKFRSYGYKTNLILNSKYKNLIENNNTTSITYVNNFTVFIYFFKKFLTQSFNNKKG